jgi:minichromosome maintenance protein 10
MKVGSGCSWLRKTRFVTEKGIREAGRESFGGDAAPPPPADNDDDGDNDDLIVT